MFSLWGRGGRIRSISPKSAVACANKACPKLRFPAEELLFLCMGHKSCPASKATHHGNRKYFDGQENLYPEAVLFRPARFRYEVDCPYCNHKTYLKICPHCGVRQPVSLGDASTMAVIGSSSSGKSCFLTSLIRHINRELSKEVEYGMSLEWRDDAGRRYFRDLQEQIFGRGQLPTPNQKEQEIKTLDLTIRFPLRGWRKSLYGSHAVIPLVFPDPSGELFSNLDDAYLLNCLAQSQQIMLMINPFDSSDYRKLRTSQGLAEIYETGIEEPTAALNFFVNKLRLEMNLSRGLIEKDLAVVLTKCDEIGLFDPDDAAYRFARQSGKYQPKLAADISRRVAQHMEIEMGMSDVVAQARANFRHVCFFAATALGKPPITELRPARGGGQERVQRIENPEPRRVEEPFLWTLHRRGYS